MEAQSLDASRRASARLEKPNPLVRLQSAGDRLSAFISGADAASLPELLLRPISEMALGGPTHTLFDRRAKLLIKEVEAMLALQSSVDRVSTRLKELVSEFGFAPNVLRRLREDAGLGDTELSLVRSPSDISGAERAVDWLRSQILDLTRGLAPDSTRTQSTQIPIPADELFALVNERLRDRRAASWQVGLWNGVRREMLHHYRELRRIGAKVRLRSTLSYLIEELLVPAAQSPATPYTGPGVYSVLLDHASTAVTESIERGSLTAHSSSEGPSEQHATRWVVALPDDYVLISSELPAAVQVECAGPLTEGSVFAVQLRPIGGCEAVALAALDLEPLFAGFDMTRSGSYRLAREPLVRILGDCSVGTVARIESRGSVDKVPVPVWRRDAGVAVRIVRSPGPDVVFGRDELETVGEAVTSCLGFQTSIIQSGVSASETAWLRWPENQSESRRTALRSESDLFDALESHAATDLEGSARRTGAPMRIAGMLRERSNLSGVVYHPPMAVPLGKSPAMRTWLNRAGDRKRELLCAVAALQCAVARAGFVVGCFHYDAVGIGLEWLGETVRPTASLLYAPLATRYGDTLPAAPRADVLRLEYSQLRFRGLTPGADDRGLARDGIDRVAFAFLALDILARRSLASSTEWLTAERVVDAAVTAPDDFWFDAPLARDLAFALAVVLERPDRSAFHDSSLESVVASLGEG